MRLVALNQRTTPVPAGEVFYISAEAVLDEAGGIPKQVYLARILLPPEEMDRIRGFVPTPDMPAEIMIRTQERTCAS